MIMRWIGVLALGIIGAGAGMAPAQEAEPVAAIAEALPAKMLKRMRANPERFLEDAAEMIYGCGGQAGIDRSGVDAVIALDRAEVRAREMQRFFAADLDNDGAVTRDELAVLASAAAAGERGRLIMAHDVADSDGDGSLSFEELRVMAQAAAMASVTEADAEAMRGVLAFDQDGNGMVGMDEVRRGIESLQNETQLDAAPQDDG